MSSGGDSRGLPDGLPPSPPPLPPRPYISLELAKELSQRSSRRPPPLPPRPLNVDDRSSHDHASVMVSEKAAPTAAAPTIPSETVLKKRGKVFWGLIIGAVIALVIIISVVATTVSAHNRRRSSMTDGGHPLPISEGGVDIGQPGDIAQFGNGSADHFVLQINRSSVVTRLDPIVNPGGIGSHLHRFHGTSYISQNRTTATEMHTLANCSTVQVQDDKSGYWVAQLFYRYPNGSFALIPIRYHAVYYFQKAPTGQTIYPFPDNYNIVAGDPYRRVVNESSM